MYRGIHLHYFQFSHMQPSLLLCVDFLTIKECIYFFCVVLKLRFTFVHMIMSSLIWVIGGGCGSVVKSWSPNQKVKRIKSCSYFSKSYYDKPKTFYYIIYERLVISTKTHQLVQMQDLVGFTIQQSSADSYLETLEPSLLFSFSQCKLIT